MAKRDATIEKVSGVVGETLARGMLCIPLWKTLVRALVIKNPLFSIMLHSRLVPFMSEEKPQLVTCGVATPWI